LNAKSAGLITQIIEQCLGLREIRSVKSLGEPIVGLSEYYARPRCFCLAYGANGQG
jgi:hypothetical protein